MRHVPGSTATGAFLRGLLSAVVALVLSAGIAPGQETVTVDGPEPELVALGGFTTFQIVAEGPGANLRDVRIPAVDGLRYQVGAAQNSRTQTYFNGRSSVRSESRITVKVAPSRVGRFEIPVFEVDTGTQRQRVGPIRFDVEKDLRGADRGYLQIQPDRDWVYVNEPIRLSIDFGVDERLTLVTRATNTREIVQDVEILAPWLDDPEGAIKLEPPPLPRGQTILAILNNAPMRTRFEAGHERGGVVYNRFTTEQLFMPTAPGRLEFAAPTLRFTVTRGRTSRDVFGRPIRSGAEALYAYSEPVSIEVRPIPTEGRPATWGNAVGRFQVEASLNERRVRIGESVKLSIVITGTGNFEFLDVPELGELEGFHFLGQNVTRTADAVTVTYDLTPLDESVTEVPSVEWSYFDTTSGVEEYVTARTNPIPLLVDPPADGGGGLTSLPGAEAANVVAGVDDIFDMKDTAVGPPVAPHDAQPLGGSAVVRLAAMLLPWLLCFAAAFWFDVLRRRRADVSGRRAAGAARAFRAALADSTEPVDALAAYLGDRLGVPAAAVVGPEALERLRAAGLDAELAQRVHAAIDAGVAARYGGGGGLDAATAKGLVDELERSDLQRGSARVAALGVAAVLMWASLAIAQGNAGGSAAERGRAAYRSGDYAAAATAFAEAAAKPEADPRLLYNLGNCHFRLGDWVEALVAYERARLAMPRDPELLANIAVVKRKLDLAGSGDGEAFSETLAQMRDRFTVGERVWIGVLLNLLAAACVVLGRGALRWVGWVATLPALVLALEVCWWGPVRPPTAIVLTDAAPVVAEPRAGLDAVFTLRRGVAVEFLGASDAWASVRVGGRRGYVDRAGLGLIE